MNSQAAPDFDLIDHLPDALKEKLTESVSADAICAVAPFDLTREGRYTEGYLVLTEDKLGEFVHADGRWDSHWTEASQIGEARIVEGLGMHLLRLLSDGNSIREFRFTLRHAKGVAKLQRQLQRRLEGKESEEDVELVEEPTLGDEKKLRCEKCGRVVPAWSEACPACMSRRKILFRLLDYVKPYKARALTGTLIAFTITGIGLVQLYLRKPMFNEGLGVAPGASPNWSLFMTYVGILGTLIVLVALGKAIQMRLMAGLGSLVARDIRQSVYAHLHTLSLSFFGRRQTGALVSRVTHDSDRMWDFVSSTALECAVAMLTIAGVGVALFVMHWKLAIIVLLPLPIMILMMVFFHRRLHTIFRRIWHRWSQMTAVIGDALPGVRVIKAFSQERREIDRFEKKSDQVYSEQMTMINIWTTFGPVMEFCTQIGLILVWLIGGWWTIQDYQWAQDHGMERPGGMSPGTMVAFLGYMMMFHRPIHRIAHMDRQFNRAATSAARIFEILDTEPGIFSKNGAHRPDTVGGSIELRNVSFSYDGIRRVLKNINLKIAPGEMLGLAGPSGGGKTTMVNLICRFYDVLEGQILVDGKDVRDYDIKSLRTKIGVVLQDPFLFHGTVAENIAYGKPTATLDEIIDSARTANAHEFIVGFPDGYDTMVGERGHSLSGGERQRISIARAILNDPAILIFDEATSSVDTEAEKLIQEALARLVANRTTIAIAHRLSTLRRADRLVILDKGELIEEGTHHELARKEDGLYARLVRMQAEAQSTMAV